MKLARRTILKALGAFAGLPLGKLLQSSIARAQGMPLPLKLIGVFHKHGVSTQCYNLRDGETETAFNLSFADSSLAPFEPFKGNLITFEGVDLTASFENAATGHGAAATLFTGSTTEGSDKKPRCESIEYFLGRTRGLGTNTPYPTLNLGVGLGYYKGDSNADFIPWGPGGGKIASMIDPYEVFDKVFAEITGTEDGAAAAARARGLSVLDFMKGDLDSLSTRLGPTEKAKLDQHLSAMRDIETRLNTIQTTTCSVPPRPTPIDIPTEGCSVSPCVHANNGGEKYFDKITDIQIGLLAQAIACGSTHFATLYLNNPGTAMSVDGVSLPEDVHNEVAHVYEGGDKPNGPPTTSQQRALGRLNRYYYYKIAKLMAGLKGAGMLDSTLILVGSDMGNPSAHSSTRIPLVLAGGVAGTAAAGRLSFGRRLKTTDLPHNRVLVSICQLFDPSIDKFGYGNDALIKGAYPGLLSS